MKKFIFSIVVALLGCSGVAAQETVKNLFEGTQAVTWANTLTIPADKFAEGVNVGDFISISLADATDVLEIKADGTWLPGSRFTRIEGQTEYRAYITTAMLSTLKQYGMEICGASFTVNGVDVKNDGFQMPEGAIWGGYFWVDNWNTLELWKTAFNNYDGQRYLDVYLEAKNDTYAFKVMTKWDDDNAAWSNSENTVKTASKVTLDLKDIKVEQALADANALMFQFNPEGGEPFNVTAIALRQDSSTAVAVCDNDPAKLVNVYNLQGVAVRTNVALGTALENLPAGLYIVDGRKQLVK